MKLSLDLSPICPSCGSTKPAQMGGSSPCRNPFHDGVGPRDPSDNGPFKLALLILLLALACPAWATTWFVAPNGGPRYDSVYNPSGASCNGQSQTAFNPSGAPDQACPYAEFQYLWDTGTSPGAVDPAHIGWVISGGDTVVISGCTAQGGQVNPANPACRIGWSAPTGSANIWCPDVGNNGCYNPPIPAGTSGAHTRFLGLCAYSGNCSGGLTQPHQYAANLTQLYGGFDLFYAFNLQNTSYVDIAGIELSVHNQLATGGGNCTLGGSPAYPQACSTSQPYDDNARNGFLLNSSSTNINFTDVYAYGFSGSGFFGPIGAGISGTRVESSFNAGDAWQFDDGSDDPNGTGSGWQFSYYTALGNGCYGEYPIVHTGFPARACYDGGSAGSGGDTLSGQDSPLQTLSLDHGYFAYNTKDSFIGPHTQVSNLTVTNSYAYGMMGASWKWGLAPSANVLFQNNVTVFNCARMQATVPGAGQNFDETTGLGGSYLSVYCRAGGDGFATLTRIGSTVKFYGNTFIAVNPTIFDINNGYYTTGNVFHQETNCGCVWDMQDNATLGYIDAAVGGGSQAPGLFYFDPGMSGAITVDVQYSDEYGIRDGSTCGGNVLCVNPLFTNQPTLPWPGSEAGMDVFNAFGGSGNSFYPSGSSPLIAAGTPLTGLTLDYYGTTRSNPPWLGGVNSSGSGPSQAAQPTFFPPAGTYGGTQSVTISTISPGAIICYNTSGAPATNGSTGCTTGTLYTTPVSVASSGTLYAVAGGTGYADSTVGSAAYTITTTASAPTFSPIAGSYAGTQTVTTSTATSACSAYLYTGLVNPPTTQTNTISVATSETVYSYVHSCPGYTDSPVSSAAYIITAPPTGQRWTGTIKLTGNWKIIQ